MITLVLGGNASGKSAFALSLLEAAPAPRALVATGKAQDLAFRRQIRDHRLLRSAQIEVRETDVDLCRELEHLSAYGAILVDSLDFWLFTAGNGAVRELRKVLAEWNGPEMIFVSQELGLGPIAADADIRSFVRKCGRMNRAVAAAADQVYLLIAGIPLRIK